MQEWEASGNRFGAGASKPILRRPLRRLGWKFRCRLGPIALILFGFGVATARARSETAPPRAPAAPNDRPTRPISPIAAREFLDGVTRDLDDSMNRIQIGEPLPDPSSDSNPNRPDRAMPETVGPTRPPPVGGRPSKRSASLFHGGPADGPGAYRRLLLLDRPEEAPRNEVIPRGVLAGAKTFTEELVELFEPTLDLPKFSRMLKPPGPGLLAEEQDGAEPDAFALLIPEPPSACSWGVGFIALVCARILGRGFNFHRFRSARK